MIHVLHRYAPAMPRLRSRATSATNAEEANTAQPRNFSEVRSRRRYAVAGILACLALALLPAANAAAQPPLVDIGTLGGGSAYPNAINATGQIVGGAYITGNSEQHAFLWTPNSPNGTTGTWTDLGKVGGVFSYAYGINDVGEVVGMTNMPPDADGNTVGDQAFLWTASTGTMTPLGTLGGWASQASGINNSHQVVGWSHWTSVSPHDNEVHAILWANGGMFDLGTLPGGTDSMANAISADGKIVGWSSTADGSMHAFLWTPATANGTSGTMQDLGTLGGTQSGATGINAAGQVVGFSSLDGDSAFHGFLWTSGSTDGVPGNLQMHDLGTFGGTYSGASGINDAGWVSGGAQTPDADHAAIWIPATPNSTAGSLADVLTLGGSHAYAYGINASRQIAGFSSLAGEPTYDSDWGPQPIIHAFVSAPSSGKFSQTIVFGPLADKTTADPDFPVTARATSGLPVSYGGSGGCTVTGNVVHLTSTGTCTVTASQAGDANFSAATPVQRSFNITRPQMVQTITFAELPNRPVGDPDFTVTASASSGLPVSFSAMYQCSINGTTVHLTGVGTCVITASQLGNAEYFQAEDVERSFVIGVTSAAGHLVDIGAPGSDLVLPTAINAYGQVLALATPPDGSPNRGFLWSPTSPNGTSGAWADLGLLDADEFNLPLGINDSGEVVGYSAGSNGPRAFIWTPEVPNGTTGTMSALTDEGLGVALAINNARQIVGLFADPSTGEPIPGLWTPDGHVVSLSFPDGGTSPVPRAISADGRVVGFFNSNDGVTHAFLWTPDSPNGAAGSTRDLGPIGGSGSFIPALGVNSAGQVAGTTQDGHAFLWSASTGMQLLDELDANGSGALGINESGTVTGLLQFSDGSQHPFVWTPAAPNGADGTMVDLMGLGGSTAEGSGINSYGQVAGVSYVTDDTVTHAFVTPPLVVNHLAQTITFASLPNRTFGNPDFSVSAAASSGLTVTFSATGSCTVNGDTVHLTGAGTCTITASQSGDGTYAAAPDVQRPFGIAKGTQDTVTINAPSALTYGGSAGTLTAGGGSGTGAVSFSAGSSTGCSVSNDQLSVTNAAGTCSVSATKAADADYNAATSSAATVTLMKGAAVLTLSNLTQAFDGTPKPAMVTTTPAGVTGVAITYNGSSTAPTNAGSYAVVASLTNNNYQASNATGTLVIVSASVKSLNLGASSAVGGVTVSGTVTLTSKAPAGGVPVALSSSNTAAATVLPIVTVPANAMSAAFSVTTQPVAAAAATVISAVFGASKTASLSVTPAALSSVTVAPATVAGGGSATGTVTLSGAAPAGGAQIALSSSLAAASVPASVTIVAGQTSKSFTIGTTAVGATAKPTISAAYLGVTKTAALTVTAPAVSSVTLSPASVKGGSASTGTVTLTGVAPAGGLVVTLSTNKSGVTVPASVTVAAGSTSAPFPIATASVRTTTSVTITASGGGMKASATLTVTP